VFDGLISGVTEWGIYVELIESKCEGLIRFQDMGKIKVDVEHYTVTDQLGNKIRLGDQIKVVVKGVDLEKKQVDFSLF
jgi:ribonuclease R